MKQYLIYTRVSTEEQGRSGLGLEAQERDIGIYLETFSEVPWEIIGRFQDVLFGGSDDRPKLVEALKLVRSSGAELLVSKLDRLSRKVSRPTTCTCEASTATASFTPATCASTSTRPKLPSAAGRVIGEGLAFSFCQRAPSTSSS